MASETTTFTTWFFYITLISWLDGLDHTLLKTSRREDMWKVKYRRNPKVTSTSTSSIFWISYMKMSRYLHYHHTIYQGAHRKWNWCIQKTKPWMKNNLLNLKRFIKEVACNIIFYTRQQWIKHFQKSANFKHTICGETNLNQATRMLAHWWFSDIAAALNYAGLYWAYTCLVQLNAAIGALY